MVITKKKDALKYIRECMRIIKETEEELNEAQKKIDTYYNEISRFCRTFNVSDEELEEMNNE